MGVSHIDDASFPGSSSPSSEHCIENGTPHGLAHPKCLRPVSSVLRPAKDRNRSH